MGTTTTPSSAFAPAVDEARLHAARLWATTRMPYFAAALFALRPQPAPGLGTFAVDDTWRLYVDPGTLADWTVPEAGAVLIHEVLHLLRDHAGRAGNVGVTDRTAEAWNLACDAEINDDLVAAGLPLPGNPVVPATLGRPDGLLAETYFRPRRHHGSADCGSGAHGRPRPFQAPAGDDDTVSPFEADAVRRTVAAETLAVEARQPGTVPGGIIRWADDQLAPAVDWRRQLATLIRCASHRAAGRVDYTHTRRSRRHTATGDIILPGLHRPVPDITVICDTSASMTPADLAAATAEVEGIIGANGHRHRRLTVHAADTTIRSTTRPARPHDIVLRGGGGTDMAAAITVAVDLRPRPDVVIVLTDGWTPWPDARPRNTAVVVGLIGPDAAPAGTVPDWARIVTIGADRP